MTLNQRRSVPRVVTRDQELNRALEAVRELLRVWNGEGNPLDRVVTVRELQAAGISVAPTVNPILPPGTGAGSAEAPDAVTGLAVTGMERAMMLEWDTLPTLDVVAYEVWRHTSDVLGSASLIGSTRSGRFIDVVDDAPAVTYYYWVRAVNLSGTTGPFNATAGTDGTALDDFTVGDDLTITGDLDHNGPSVGFFGTAPVAQQGSTGSTTGFTQVTGSSVTDASTFTGGSGTKGYTIDDIVLALKSYGLLDLS